MELFFSWSLLEMSQIYLFHANNKKIEPQEFFGIHYGNMYIHALFFAESYDSLIKFLLQDFIALVQWSKTYAALSTKSIVF